MKKLITIAAIGGMMCASNALASGFALREQSNAALGNAFAGATAGAEDISYSFFNPAGLTRHKGTQVNGGATWIAPRSKAKRAEGDIPNGLAPNSYVHQYTGYTGDIVHPAAAPNAYASHQINDNFTAAVSVNVPFGMITKYNDDWAGRMHGTLSKVETVTVTPMLAYKVHGMPELSLGAGLQIQYIKAKLRNGVVAPAPVLIEDEATLKGDATDIGYTLGALYEWTDNTRFGVGYRSQIKHKLKGDIKFDGLMTPANQDISARITTPASLTFGAYHDINDTWAVMAEVGQTYWSSFDELRINGAKNGTMSITEENWKDTTFYALGVNYRINDKWKARAGFAFDQSAVGTAYRTPRIPEADRKWYSLGLEYKYTDNVTVNLGYTYIRANNGIVALSGNHAGDNMRGSLYADYSNDVHIGGLGFNYAF